MLERHPTCASSSPATASCAQLEELARPLGDRFELLGERADVPDLLASFDVFAFPSRFEGSASR